MEEREEEVVVVVVVVVVVIVVVVAAPLFPNLCLMLFRVSASRVWGLEFNIQEFEAKRRALSPKSLQP